MRVDGSVRAKSHRLEGGEEVEFEPPEQAVRVIEAEDVPFRVAYEDEHLLVVDKPAGVVVHPGAGPRERHARPRAGRAGCGRGGGPAGDRAQARPGHLGPPRRRALGRGAQAAAGARARAGGRARLRRPRPRASPFVAGPDRRADRARPGRSDAPLARHRHAQGRGDPLRGRRAARRPCAARRPARDGADASDPRPPGSYRPPSRRGCGLRRSRPALGRQFLHANRLAFTHPFTNERIEIESPLPGELAGYLERLSAGGART